MQRGRCQYVKKKREEKKTEHTIISHTSQNSECQNIHVMLSYANITTHKKINAKTSSILKQCYFYAFVC